MLDFVWNFANKIIMFQKKLQFWKDIVLCYSKHITMEMTPKVPPLLTWHISQIIVNYILTIITCVLNQSHGHWLLSDVLQYAIVMNLKLKKLEIPLALDNMMNDDVGVALGIDLTYF